MDYTLPTPYPRPSATSTLQGPLLAITTTLGTDVQNSQFCGFSMNETFTLGDLTATEILPWAKMYKYCRVRRIHIKISHKRVMPVYGGVGITSTSVTNNGAIYERQRTATTSLISQRGGDMVFMCTNRTGPMVEEQTTDSELVNSQWQRRTGYALIRQNPQLRRKAVFRNDVAYGMRPIKFSFRPGVLIRNTRQEQMPLVGTGTEGNELQGLISRDTGLNDSRNPSSNAGWRYAPAGWWQMVMPQFPGKSSAASGGPGSLGAGAVGGSLTYLSEPTEGATRWDPLRRWLEAALFGMYYGLQPGTALVWPTNLQKTIAFELEFKGLRNFNTTSNDGAPQPYFKDWGNLPTARMY